MAKLFAIMRTLWTTRLCTASVRDVRAQTKDSSDIDDYSSSSKSQKKWLNLNGKKYLSAKRAKRAIGEDDLVAYDRDFTERGGLDSPVWQRTILMGERCEPPVFSGLVFYDECGNRVQDFPLKSPRAAATPPSLLQLTVN